MQFNITNHNSANYEKTVDYNPSTKCAHSRLQGGTTYSAVKTADKTLPSCVRVLEF